MSTKRPGAGVRVSGGKLRVDAARAIDKLRSYQLADPLAWVLEVVRAGVVFPESEHVAVEGEGGDLFVSITCAPPAVERVPRLFEELVDPSAAPDARGLRLLAMGVNAALGRTEGGAATRHVDVYVIDAEGASRVRFTPQLFRVEEETGVSLGLRSLHTETATPPAHAPRPRRGILVHTRAVMGLGTLARWAFGEEARELGLVRDAAREARIPVTVQGLPVAGDPALVMRAPIEGGGYVALVTPRAGRTGATLEAAESGVVLSREPWSTGIGSPGATLPLLLRVDRERLPTNAARSAVRWDEPMAAAALEDAQRALGVLITDLAAAIDETDEPGRLSWLRTLGLTLLAAEARGVSFREKLASGSISAPLLPLLDAKLLFDAVGRRRTPRELASSTETSVHYASTFADRSIEPWVGHVLAALPGDPTHLLWGDLPPESAAALIEGAQLARENEARWLAIPVESPTVKSTEGSLARVRLPPKLGPKGRIPAEGEVVLGTPGEDRVLAVHLRGRCIQTRRGRTGVGISSVVSSELLRPTLAYDGVVDDETLRTLLAAADTALMAGCDAIARVLLEEKVQDASIVVDRTKIAGDPRAHALVRYAILSAVGRDESEARRTIFTAPIGRAAVWATATGSAISLSEMARLDAIGVVERGKRLPDRLPRKRPVLVLDDAERTALKLLFPRIPMVDYGRTRGPVRSLAEMTLTLSGRLRVGLVSEGEDFRAIAAWCDTSEPGIEAFHLGVRLGLHGIRGSHVPVVVVIDDERIVPDEVWSAASVNWGALEEWHQTQEASARIAHAVVRTWLGEKIPSLVSHVALDDAGVVRAVLREARELEMPSTSERARLAELPLLPSLRGERVSAESIKDDGRVGYVPEGTFAPRLVKDLAFDVLLGTKEEAHGVAVLTGGGVYDATTRVREAMAKSVRDGRLSALAKKKEESFDLFGASPTTRVLGDGLEGVIGYRPHGGAGQVSVLVDRRWLLDLEDASFPPNVAVKVSVEPRLLDDEATALSPTGEARVRGAIQASARTLLVALVTERPSALFRDDAVRALATHLVGAGKRRGEVGAMLRSLAELPTLVSSTGAPSSISAAIVDDELLAVREAMAVVAPAQDGAASPLDRPLAVVPWEPADERALLLEKIAGVKVRDVSRELRALYAARRAERGLVARPTLSSGHEPSLCRTIEELARATPEPSFVTDTLGFGVIGLSPAKQTYVRFFVAGTMMDSFTLTLVPAFEAAIESPLFGAEGLALLEARAEIERALTMVLAQLLRRLADENAFEGAPDWALDAQLDAALLGGATHLERLGPLRLFRTTAGTRVSYTELVAQRKRFGPLWWTPDPYTTQVPLDPERFALRLTPGHARELGRVVTLTDGTEELRLDAIARRNRARPPVLSIAPTDVEQAAAIGTETTADAGGYELVVSALWPAFAAMEKLVLHIGQQPLGEIDAASEVPILARARSSELVPDRTWSGPVRDATLLAIEREAAEIAEEITSRAVRVPQGAMPSIAIDRGFMGNVAHAAERVIRGSLTLGPLDLDEADEGGVRTIDARANDPEGVEPRPLRSTPGKREAVVVPLEGTLLVWGEPPTSDERTLDSVARHAYTRLLAQLAARVATGKSPDADLDRAHLVRGAELGFTLGEKIFKGDVPMPFGLGALAQLSGVIEVLGKTGAVVALAEGEDHAHEALARYPMFHADGSLAAQRLTLALGPRVISRSDALALVLGLRQAEAAARPPPAKPREKKEEKEEPKKAAAAPPTKSAKKQKQKPVRVSSGPVEPLAARAKSVLRELGRDVEVVVSASSSEPLAHVGSEGVILAGSSELLALAAGTTVHRERSAILVAAHVVSVSGNAGTLTALARLLE